MPYCQNCGTEVAGNFCPNCGTPVGSASNTISQPIIHQNAIVKPRYKIGHIVLAGYLGCSFLFAVPIVALISLFIMQDPSILILFPIIACVILLGIAFLCFLPGILSIRKNSPANAVGKTIFSFVVKSLFFLLAWSISIMGSMFIIGLFFGVWRLGLAVSKPKDTEYTAFVNGEKRSVIRLIDEQYTSVGQIRYIYIDENGEYYRPPIR